ncbi:glycosyltransferase family 4 protein [Crocosphaera sp. XPORK-15E]|uniref:glycosyltransferase family 4 protein n=1 Tax=Crocosphaera sp. XPORK-15E TaxID=3110247 RepID=UPI002B1F0B84|nr:glycosyltransferase family 4 protein [Crocosphaera sp. XPORK-15E]MEA5533513.1 glycosyltransferase family 4 protein [Crocosphaera sp. XPORK-15E]
MNIKTLFITREAPYPIFGGVRIRNWQNINIMMNFGPVAIFSAANWSLTPNSLSGITLWEHYNVEEQRSPWEQGERRFWWLRPSGHPDADWPYSRLAAQKLAELMTKFKPDIVIFEQVWLFRYLPIVKNYPCHIIFDNHNVEAHLFAQPDRSKEPLTAKLKANLQLAHLKQIEGELTRQSDQVWVCSQEDAHLLGEMYGKDTPIYVVPNGVNIDNYKTIRSGQCPPPQDLEKTEHIIFYSGQLSYYPNTVAAELLIDEIYPKIKQKYPDCRLLLVGRVPNQKMLEAAQQDPDIIVTGTVPNVEPYLSLASVMVVPLLHGGGTRLKILEAFAAGCPVISTAKGVEGIQAKDGEALLIRNTIDEIVEGIEQLWSQPSLAAKLADNAYKIVQEKYSWEANYQRIEQAIKAIFS